MRSSKFSILCCWYCTNLISGDINSSYLKPYPYTGFSSLSVSSFSYLIKAAKLNTPQLMGYEFSDMKNVLNEIIEIKSSKKICSNISISEIENGIPMYVLSNRYKTEGAACILYPKLLSKIGNNLKSSYYIIPSSIHEVLILPARNTDSSMEIQAMIREINDTLVAAEEILSYSLYFYEEDDGRMYIV